METLKQWAVSVCVFALAAGIIQYSAPKGETARALKFAVATVILCVFISPLFRLNDTDVDLGELFDNELSLSTVGEYEERLALKIAKQLESESKASVSQYLDGLGLTDKSIFVQTDIIGLSSIRIKQIEIILNPEDMNSKEKIEKELAADFGCEIVVKEDYYA